MSNQTCSDFRPGHVTLIAGAPCSGKTTYAMAMMIDHLREGNSCLFLTADMRRESVVKRFGNMLPDWETDLLNQKLFIEEAHNLDGVFALRRIAEAKRAYGISLAIVDGFQLLLGNAINNGFWLQLAAQHLRIPIIFTIQKRRVL